ncbi:glycosyltransferase [aff. Roholtiella sp. LEGE 12411]|uniref:glycosyltransferase n=1 Tax=aff. Roholtiella sp. LEGE 12411 TaxID=1828822 RepID=UPI001881DD99|nr:glycosyltransferase [aff. Roholtiella sp. LEGE 12411]MBE9038618.1 glycosyltransferase [aff. Roholtiella sp. LEGE 12411]
MTHFGVLCLASTGHLNPMTTLARELQQRGHRVTLFAVPDARPKALIAGIEFCTIGESEFPAGSMPQLFAQLGKLSGLAAMRYTINWFKQVAAMTFQDAPEAIRAAGVEALLIDQAIVGAGSIADFLDIPFISVCNALLFNLEDGVPPFVTPWNYDPSLLGYLRNRVSNCVFNRVMIQPIRKVVEEFRQTRNLPPYSSYSDVYSKLAQISQQPVEFEFPRRDLPQCFHFTGPFIDSACREPVFFPFESLTEQPLIYASMGTLQNCQQYIFRCIAEACVGLDAQLIISLGGSPLNSTSLPKFPGAPLVVGHAPQLELLKKASLTITHAGLNTALESLSNGVPMVAIPITNDQPGVAARLSWTGTGDVVLPSSLSVSRLRAAIKRVLSEVPYKNNATRLQKAIRLGKGLNRAADIIEQVIATGKPVLAKTHPQRADFLSSNRKSLAKIN